VSFDGPNKTRGPRITVTSQSTILLGRGLVMSISDVSEFSSVSYDIMLIMTLLRCSLKVPIIREARVYPLPQKIWVGGLVWVSWILVSSHSFHIILYLFWLYLGVVWRSHWDERRALIQQDNMYLRDSDLLPTGLTHWYPWLTLPAATSRSPARVWEWVEARAPVDLPVPCLLMFTWSEICITSSATSI
jgi:hypothetical protein